MHSSLNIKLPPSKNRALPMKKNLAAVGVVAGLGIGGFVGVTMFSPGASNAQSAAPAAPAAADAKGATTDDGDAWHDNHGHDDGDAWHGKDRSGDRAVWEAKEAADGTDAKLLAQAKITPSQAAAAAVAVAPGTAGTPDLHARDGALGYHVEVATATGRVEVRVDATTGVATIDKHGHDDGDARHGKEHSDDDASTPAAA